MHAFLWWLLYLETSHIRNFTSIHATADQRLEMLLTWWNTNLQHTETNSIWKESITRTETRYKNIERGTQGTLQWLEKFDSKCFVMKASIIMDDKPLVAVFRKDVATLIAETSTHTIKNTPIQRILYRFGWDLFRADWVWRIYHKEDHNNKIPGIKKITTINIVHKTLINQNVSIGQKSNTIGELSIEVHYQR